MNVGSPSDEGSDTENVYLWRVEAAEPNQLWQSDMTKICAGLVVRWAYLRRDREIVKLEATAAIVGVFEQVAHQIERCSDAMEV